MGMRISSLVEKLLEEVIVSFLEWDPLVYFFHNQDVCSASEQIAKKIGRNPKEVSRSLNFLQSKGVLIRKKKDRLECFQFIPDSEYKKAIDEFIVCLEDRLCRLEIFSSLLSHEYR